MIKAALEGMVIMGLFMAGILAVLALGLLVGIITFEFTGYHDIAVVVGCVTVLFVTGAIVGIFERKLLG